MEQTLKGVTSSWACNREVQLVADVKRHIEAAGT